eukprot:2472439-Amphidinium_carterae.2
MDRLTSGTFTHIRGAANGSISRPIPMHISSFESRPQRNARTSALDFLFCNYHRHCIFVSWIITLALGAYLDSRVHSRSKHFHNGLTSWSNCTSFHSGLTSWSSWHVRTRDTPGWKSDAGMGGNGIDDQSSAGQHQETVLLSILPPFPFYRFGFFLYVRSLDINLSEHEMDASVEVAARDFVRMNSPSATSSARKIASILRRYASTDRILEHTACHIQSSSSTMYLKECKANLEKDNVCKESAEGDSSTGTRAAVPQ